MHDVLIAGGGPAGLATAICAAQAGLSPLIVEPKAGTIDKACGEGLMPGAVRALERLGATPARSYPFLGVRYVEGQRVAEGRFPQGPGLGVRRLALHEALTARADALGIPRREGRVGEIRQHTDHVEAAGEQARWLVAADGLHSTIRKGLGLEGTPRRSRPRMGLRRHFALQPWSPFVEVYWHPEAEAYVTPVAEDLVGVAILFSGEPLPPGKGAAERYDLLLRRFPALAERLGQPCTSVRGSGPFERNVSRRVAGRVLLVGDAAGYLDPLTGEGIRLGFAAAEAAVRRIQQNQVERYEGDWLHLTRRYRWMTRGLLWLRDQPLLRPLMLPFLQHTPGAFSRIIGALAED